MKEKSLPFIVLGLALILVISLVGCMPTPIQSPQQPIEVVSVLDTTTMINPGGPTIKITLKNVSDEPIVSLNVTMEEGGPRSFDFGFEVTPSNPLQPNKSISSERRLIGGGFGGDPPYGNFPYSLTIKGTMKNGGTFDFTWEPPSPSPATTPTSEPVSTPLPSPDTGLPFRINVSTAPAHLPGERIMFGIGITNLSSGTITLDPFSPAMWIKPMGQDKAVYSSPAGTRTFDIGTDPPFYPNKDTWDQKNNNGQQVAPGWYEIGYEYVIFEKNTGKRYTANPTTRFQIVNPDSAMNKDLDVNRSVTADGITVTLERIELNAVNVKVYIFTTPPGYTVPQAGSLEQSSSFVMHSAAEYSVDGGVTKQPVDIGAQFNKDGARLIWDIDPIPVDAKEMTFAVLRLGELEGRWEFKIPLE